MKARRRLSDLYVRGKEVELNDGQGEPVTVWLQKLNSVDRESCLRRANAAKARFMLEADKEDSEIFQAMYIGVREMHDRDGLVSLVIAEDVAKFRQRFESERSVDEETWGKDAYLQGLIDSWIGDDDNPGLAAAQTQDPDDPEAKRVLAEIERFEAEINAEVRTHTEMLQKDWELVDEDTLWRKATHRVLEIRGNESFNREFERQQLYYCTRNPDNHATRYFGTLQEIDDLDENVATALIRHYGVMAVDVVEGKDSPVSRSSSNSSDPSSEAEVSADSGPEDAST